VTLFKALPIDTPTTILCVDDEAAVLFTQTAILQAAGFRVFTAESGVEAISIFQAEQVDVSVCPRIVWNFFKS
jgi:CheY-like chemotaxis protein